MAGTVATAGAALAGSVVRAKTAFASDSAGTSEPFRYCLNMATIMGQELDPAQEADIAAKAGYSAIEPWVRNLRQYVEAGHSATDLRKRIADAGLTVEGAIGFAAWAVDDETQRKKGLDEFKRDMELVASIGGKRIAASPAGINRTLERGSEPSRRAVSGCTGIGAGNRHRSATGDLGIGTDTGPYE